jgi:hypothetical protein
MTEIVDAVAGLAGWALPPFVYAALRWLRFPQAVALGAGALSVVLAAAGCRAPGLPVAALALAVAYGDYSRERRIWPPAICLAATALLSTTAAIWAALSGLYFLYAARRPLRTLAWLGAVCLLGFSLPAAAWLPRFGAGAALEPSVLACSALLTAPAVGAGVWTLVAARRTGGPDHRLLFLAHAAVMAGALLLAAPALPVPVVAFPAPVGFAISVGALVLTGLTPLARRWEASRPRAPVSIERLECEFESAPPRWGGMVPAAVILALLALRLIGAVL